VDECVWHGKSNELAAINERMNQSSRIIEAGSRKLCLMQGITDTCSGHG
jgi:hypothetical protein